MEFSRRIGAHDLLSLEPLSQSAFHYALDCSLPMDLISLDLMRPSDYRPSSKQCSACLRRGLAFEVKTATLFRPGPQSSHARQGLASVLTQLNSVCQFHFSRLLVVSSCLESVWEVRRPQAIAAVLQSVGLTSSQGALAMQQSNPYAVLTRGLIRTRSTHGAAVLLRLLADPNVISVTPAAGSQKIDEADRGAAGHGASSASALADTDYSMETEFRNRSASNAVETAGPVLDSILFSTAVVERELQNLKEAKSSGPDNIPAKFLKELANELSKPLANIFRSSFELGRLPSEWKTANIFPIYKGGARSSANNYRPVSLTCICCKLMEAIVKKATMKFLEQNHLLSDLQHGFRQNRSCLSSLLLSTEQWTRALGEDGGVDVIYTDFKKAFDSVPHRRPIYKLSEIGIRGSLLTWITDFLTGRSQSVCVEVSRSTPTPVLSGVPQGSVLGPLLFLVYINDCIDDLECIAITFADDVKLWTAIRSDADTCALQDSLSRLNSWSARWLLNFNVDKCVVLRLRTKRTSKEDDSFQYVLSGQSLSNVAEQKDLGVLMTSSMKPSSQCQKEAKSAIRVLFALRRGFVQIDRELFGKTYGTFVRSHLEYAVQAWRPWLKKDYQRLERVQAMATKMVKNLHHLPYETRLTELNQFPLNYRQLRGDLIQTYRIVRGRECALNFDEFFELAGTARLCAHPFKLQRKLADSDVRRNDLSHRDVIQLNGFPAVHATEQICRVAFASTNNFYSMPAKNRFLQKNIDELLEDFEVLSDASFVSDEGVERGPSPPAKNTLGKQVRSSNFLIFLEEEEPYVTELSSAGTAPVVKADKNVDNQLVASRSLQPSASSNSSGTKSGQSKPPLKYTDTTSVPSALADHLPRKLAPRTNPHPPDQPPLPHCSPIVTSLNSLSLQDIAEVSEVSNARTCISSLDLSAVDEPEFASPTNPPSLSQPSCNSVRILQEEVITLSKNIANTSNKAPSAQAEKEAFDRLVGQFSLSERPAPTPATVARVPVSINFPRNEPVFVDLLEVSVSESEIVRKEKEKVAHRRRQLLTALKKCEVEEPLPEPCPMKFFDLQQHVFQSARLHIIGIPNLLPELNGLSEDQVAEISNEYRRSLPSYYL
ncbi:hypothetical protein SprV_0100378700 [Sparganum proliferum]